MKRQLLVAAALVLSFTGTSAWAQGVQFVEGLTYRQVLDSARQAGKKVFIDCYTSWCGPCKMMTRDVFPKKECGDYINPRFVAAKFDMEKGEGPELAKKFHVQAFPTFLVVDPASGLEVARMVGGSEAKKFIEDLDNNLKGETLATMTEKYANGERGDEFVMNYMQKLAAAYQKKELVKVLEEHLKGREELLLKDVKLFRYFYNINDINSPLFRYGWEHRTELDQSYGGNVSSFLKRVWTSYAYSHFIGNRKNNYALDEAGLLDYLALLKKEGIDNIEKLELNVRLRQAQLARDWATQWNLIKQGDEKQLIGNAQAANALKAISDDCTDMKLRKEASRWAAKRAKDLKAKEQKQQNDKAVRPAEIRLAGQKQVYFPDEFQKLADALKNSPAEKK